MLHEATSEENVKAAEILLERGADLHIEDANDQSPLDYSAFDGGSVFFKILLGAIPDINLTDPLLFHKTLDNEAINLDFNNEDGEEQEEREKHQIAVDDLIAKIGLLIQKGLDVNTQDGGGTPLHLLMALCADSNGPNEKVLLKMLLDAGADPNIQDENGDTALHLVAELNKSDVAVMLLKAGANNRIQNNAQKIAAQLAPSGSILQLHLNRDFSTMIALKSPHFNPNSRGLKTIVNQMGQSIMRQGVFAEIIPNLGRNVHAPHGVPVVPVIPVIPVVPGQRHG